MLELGSEELVHARVAGLDLLLSCKAVIGEVVAPAVLDGKVDEGTERG